MTLNDMVELLADTTRWRERVVNDTTMDPDTRQTLLDSITVLRRFARRRVQNPRPGDRWRCQATRSRDDRYPTSTREETQDAS
jgi:hypothetical protein